MTEEAALVPLGPKRVGELTWTLADPATCRYYIRVRSDVSLPIFAAIYGGRVVGHDCGDPPGPVMFRSVSGMSNYYETEVCFCGIGGSQTVILIASEPISNDPEHPSDAVTLSFLTPSEGCPSCLRNEDEMPAAARTTPPAAKAAKPAKAKPAKKPAPKKPAKPVKKVVAKKPAPKKPAKPVKKKPGRRK